MRRVIFALALALAGCCGGGIVASPQPPLPTDPCAENLCITTSAKNKVDILFVLDDAPTMADKLATFRASLPAMLDSLTQYAANGEPAWYHLGVVTSDLGAGPDAIPALGCKPSGDGAVLRGSADMGGGERFIDYDQLSGASNVPDVAATLASITDVGSGGCDIRQPLEAAYRALHDDLDENLGFLRSDALLVVVFVTDADDCSVPVGSDLFDGSSAGVAEYGPLDRFRCTQHGIACNGAPVPAAAVSGLTGCTSYDGSNGGKLTDISQYADFFTRPGAQGGVKADPNDVKLVALAGPVDPVGVTVTSPCAFDATIAMCPKLNPSCVAPNDTLAFGDPAVRLATVVHASQQDFLGSICASDDSDVMRMLVPVGQGGLDPGCIKTLVATRADGTPDCAVDDVTTAPDGTQTTRELPSCAENGDTPPCWQLVDRLAQYDSEGCMLLGQMDPTTCELPPACQPVLDPTDGMRQLYTVTIDRGPNGPAAGSTTSIVHCAT
ncbi:MAG TPA: hypothetical protein VGL86_31245 [Polyangia bacterium]|jgi:hypothetical protein